MCCRKAEEFLRLSEVRCPGLLAQTTATGSAVMCLELAARAAGRPLDKVRGGGGQREGTGHRPEPGGLWFGLGFVCVKEPRRRALNKANSGCKCLKITRPSRVWPSRWVSASVQ